MNHEPIFRVLSPRGALSMPGPYCRSARAPLLTRCFSDHAPWNLDHLILISLPLGARSIPANAQAAALIVCSAFATDLCSRFAADLLLGKQKNRGFPP